MLRTLRPKPRTLKFHVHDSLLFNQQPQTAHINSALLRNDVNKLISPEETSALQKSFETLLRSYNIGKMDHKDLLKLYSKVYYPFLTQAQVRDCFKERSMAQLQKFVIKHERLTHEGSMLLRFIKGSPMLDFGVLRGEYYASLGLGPLQYGTLLRSSNKLLFQGHDKQNLNFSKVLTMKDGQSSALTMERYLKSSSSLHKSTNLKNYIVVNSPVECEMYANLAQRFGTRIIVLTGKNFEASISPVAPLLYDYQLSKLRGSYDSCSEIRSQLMTLQFLPMKDVSELIQFISVVEDDMEPTTQMFKSSFDETLKQMELSILGKVETDLRQA